MERFDIVELHFITPIINLPSILKHGILCHNHSQNLASVSVAMPEVQERRKNKKIPGVGNLHDYANLYFDAHNPMLSARRHLNDTICVLRIDPVVLDLPKVIISDQNAARQYARFYCVEAGLKALDKALVFAAYWTDFDPIEQARRAGIKCAEVLVPDKVESSYVQGAYTANETALSALRALRLSLSVAIKSGMYF